MAQQCSMTTMWVVPVVCLDDHAQATDNACVLAMQLRRAPEHPAEGAKPQHRPEWKPVEGVKKPE
jgi:hypothetical protein